MGPPSPQAMVWSRSLTSAGRSQWGQRQHRSRARTKSASAVGMRYLLSGSTAGGLTCRTIAPAAISSASHGVGTIPNPGRNATAPRGRRGEFEGGGDGDGSGDFSGSPESSSAATPAASSSPSGEGIGASASVSASTALFSRGSSSTTVGSGPSTTPSAMLSGAQTPALQSDMIGAAAGDSASVTTLLVALSPSGAQAGAVTSGSGSGMPSPCIRGSGSADRAASSA